MVTTEKEMPPIPVAIVSMRNTRWIDFLFWRIPIHDRFFELYPQGWAAGKIPIRRLTDAEAKVWKRHHRPPDGMVLYTSNHGH